MVFAPSLVDSVRRLAARPVGAHKVTRAPLARTMPRMLLTTVVLPTPGPPVITVSLLLMAVVTAWRCEAGDPPTLAFHVLTGTNGHCRANHRSKLSPTRCFDSEHAETAFLAVKSDAFDRAAKLLSRAFGRVTACPHRIPSRH